jgi:hypothetical protein
MEVLVADLMLWICRKWTDMIMIKVGDALRKIFFSLASPRPAALNEDKFLKFNKF